MKFKFLEHTADIKFQGYGKTLEEAFVNSALAMFTSLNDSKIPQKISKKIKVKGKDNENLLHNFLAELLFLLETEDFFLSKVKKIKIKDNEIEAEVLGDNAEKYEMENHIKAVTYHDMFVRKQKDKYTTQVIVDV